MEFILDTLGKIGFDWRAAVFSLLNFFVVYWLLKKYAFGPVVASIEKRNKLMKEGVDNAQQAKTELQMAERRAQELIDESKVQPNRIVEKSHDDAKALGEQLKDKAKKEIELLILQAKKNIDIDKKEMKETLRRETVELVVMAVEKIMIEKLDDKKDEKMIQDILSSLK